MISEPSSHHAIKSSRAEAGSRSSRGTQSKTPTTVSFGTNRRKKTCSSEADPSICGHKGPQGIDNPPPRSLMPGPYARLFFIGGAAGSATPQLAKFLGFCSSHALALPDSTGLLVAGSTKGASGCTYMILHKHEMMMRVTNAVVLYHYVIRRRKIHTGAHDTRDR